MDDQSLLMALNNQVKETFSLWDPGWVTFNWRGYTYDHTQRVRGLAVNLCRQEGGDTRVTELAALLHDITKPYDGEYIVDETGKRIVDENGYWHNEIRRPSRQNRVTRLYSRLGLKGRLHNESGAIVAEHLLRDYDVDEVTCRRVAETILNHLRPGDDLPVESACLYDADTIDANIGLPAFVRNIYIHLHFHDQRKPPEEPSIATLLADSPTEYLIPYIRENLPKWGAGKRRDFVPRLLTESARTLAQARLDRLMQTFGWLSDELDAYQEQADHTGVDVVLHYMRHRDDPSISEETAYLAERWLTEETRDATRRFVSQIQREIAGIE